MLKRKFTYVISSLILFLVNAFSTQVIAATHQIIVPEVASAQDKYANALLKKALRQQVNNHYQIKTQAMNLGNQALQQSLDSDEISVMWQATSNALEERFYAVKIPIYKGLGGYKVVLMKNDFALLSANNLTASSLKKHSFGQLRASESASTLLENGFTTHTSNKPVNLVRMLEGERFDMLPVSVIELDDYTQIIKQEELEDVITDHPVALSYTQPVYFFTRDARLAHTINQGLMALIDTGEFDAYFYQQHFVQKSMMYLNKDELNIVQLNNPLLPLNTPVAKNNLWVGFDNKDSVVAQNK